LQWGFIAEDTLKIAPDFVNLDEEGLPHSIRYHDMIAPTINEMQKLKKEISELKNEIIDLKKYIK
jgi:hypothetical protein